MFEDDLLSLCRVIARAVEASNFQRRDVERVLGLRNGSLGKLLEGGVDLRVEHLTALARVLRVPPGDFLRVGCPRTQAAATHRLADWIGPMGDAPTAPASVSAPAPTPEELTERIRLAIRQELAARKGT
jgi:transcriptional regulator with XRE-family HTH domain